MKWYLLTKYGDEYKMGNIKVIAEHSVDLYLLSGGICIDAGCRGFQFSEAMRDLGCKVVAFDVEKLTPPSGIWFYNKALWHEDGVQLYYNDTKDQQAKHISDKGVLVESVSIGWVRNAFRKIEYDVLKLDVEGSEYFILSDPDFEPIFKQVSVEFHLHAHRSLHDQYYDKCMENLLKWYEPVKHELTQAHGAGLNYWDSLFIRKDLL